MRLFYEYRKQKQIEGKEEREGVGRKWKGEEAG